MGAVEPVSPKEREYAYPERRAWLAAVIADAVSRSTGQADEPDGQPLDVASSYAAAFHPLAMPAVGHDDRLPDGSVQNYGEYTQLPKAEDYEDLDWEGTVSLSSDSGGGFVRDSDGRIVRDRREVARLLRDSPDLQRFALGLLAEPPATGRKRRKPWTIARGLLFADLQPVLGTRRAARLLLAWEDELGAPWRDRGAAGLVARFRSLRPHRARSDLPGPRVGEGRRSSQRASCGPGTRSHPRSTRPASRRSLAASAAGRGRRSAPGRPLPGIGGTGSRRSSSSRLGVRPRLPERRVLGHRAELKSCVGQRGAQRLVGGTWKLAPTALAALASIAVEDRLALDADVAGSEADHLRAPSAGEDEGQQQRSIPPAGDRVRAPRPASRRTSSALYPRATDWVARGRSMASQGLETTRPIRDQEAVEARQAGDPGADRRRRRRPARLADAVDPGQNVGWLDSVGRLAELGEEGPEHPGVGLDGSLGA
jgi:hypothetical protein